MPSVDGTTPHAAPVLGHVNLMVDTFISNVNLIDLQDTIRRTLATSPPSVAAAFTAAARDRLTRSKADAVPDPVTLFVQKSDSEWEAAADLEAVLHRARALYGSGLGLASLRVLTAVVAGASRIRWEPDSDMETLLAYIDADIAQAVVSTGQEVDAGRMGVEDEAETHKTMTSALKECADSVAAWDGDFPFERALDSVEQWKPGQAPLGR
ncbi:hypothetical protein L226DRAFT_531645 [Lentinus tigrinus ALCF2SS1-7]|uniref:uncharacterized protein n=1 Tax=Lentinus tigrinus ALCF2SS1-7 TaxID=1328758 RepID=UPI001165EEED|nr:hypothetical protein L226DRAFT_531645 [Lentinus tigrinus ALCF2SS1-7]